MNFDIKQLTIFIEVADKASFSKAAQHLGMAQASVSERIAALEKIVGVKLFNRLGRKVELTLPGERLVLRARELVTLRDSAASELKQLIGLQVGDIKIGGSTAPGEYLLPSLLGDFKKEYPQIGIRLSIGNSDSVIEWLENGSIEIGLVGKRETKEHLAFKKIWTDDLILVASKDHPFAKVTQPLSAKELAKVSWVIRGLGSGTRDAVEKVLKKLKLGNSEQLTISAVLGSVAAVKEGVKHNLGVTIVSKITVKDEIAVGNLVEVPVIGLAEQRSFFLARDKRRTLSPAARALHRFLSAAAKHSS